MNLPPDKLKLLSQYDNDKKWELVCDQVRAFYYLFIYFLNNFTSSNGESSLNKPLHWDRVDAEYINRHSGSAVQSSALSKTFAAVSVVASDSGVGMATVSGLCQFYLDTRTMNVRC